MHLINFMTEKNLRILGCNLYHGIDGMILILSFPRKQTSGFDSLLFFITLITFYLTSESQMTAICDSDEQCLYDTKAMGSLEIGENTRNAHRYYKFIHEAMKPGK